MTTAQQRRRWTAGLYLSCVLVLCAAAIGLRPGLRALERGWTKLSAAAAHVRNRTSTVVPGGPRRGAPRDGRAARGGRG